MKSSSQIIREWISVVVEAETPNIDSKIYGENLNFTELRREARLMLQRLRGNKKQFHNSSANIDILLSNTSITNSISHAGPDILKLLSALDYILENGKFINEEPPKDHTEPSLISVLRFSATVSLVGIPRKVITVVKKQNSGNYVHYSLHNMVDEVSGP